MKKQLITLLLLTTTLTLSAAKGEKFISAKLSANFKKETTDYISSTPTATLSTSQQNFTIGAGSEFGYFIADNFKVGIGLSGAYSAIETDNQVSTESSSFAIALSPNIAYYVRITDRFSYTPELGANFSLGKGYSDDVELNAKSWDIYLKFIAFEFRISERFALGVDYGSIGYSSISMTPQNNRDTLNEIHTKGFNLNAQGGSLHARFYLGGKKE